MKNWWKQVSSGWDKESRAQREVDEAKERVSHVTSTVRKDVDAMERQLLMQQGLLQRSVHQGAPRAQLIDMTKKIKHLQRQLVGKKRLVGNMGREERQLTDAYTNAQVAAAMMQSVEAQKKMEKLCLGGRDAEEMDDVLDEIDEHREATSDLTDRLAARGGDDNEDIFDDYSFSDKDLMGALGMTTNARADSDLLNSTRHSIAESINMGLSQGHTMYAQETGVGYGGTEHVDLNRDTVALENYEIQANESTAYKFPEIPSSKPFIQKKANSPGLFKNF